MSSVHSQSPSSNGPVPGGSRNRRGAQAQRWIVGACLLLLCGCTSWRDYFHNGFKVGPNYGRPATPVAKQWIDADDLRVKTDEDDMCQWWTVFHDPVLDELVCTAYHQNLTLREAGFRVLEARAQLGIAIGSIFPQTQNASGNYMAIANSQETAQGAGFGPQFFQQWNFGFNLAWELDFWGRFRRAVEEDSDLLNASVEDYDGALVTLLGDVATAYVNMRTLEQRIKYAEDNVKIQKDTLDIVEARFKVSTISELDVDQARTTLEATEAAISELQIELRQTILQLCTLLGMPPEDLLARVGKGPIPTAPKDVAVGIPADLLRRRPDVRAAERRLAAQCAAIGIAESEFYPHISIVGTLGWSAQNLGHLLEPGALNSNVGPSFEWDLLNYGRLLNNVKLQDATFQELLATYQNSVLNANQDVENGLVTFLRGQERTAHQQASVDSAIQAVNIAIKQYQAGTADFTTVTQVEQIQVQQQDLLAQAEGEIGTGLITVYRALGGGWQIRLQGCNAVLPPSPAEMNAGAATPESVPTPAPQPPANAPAAPPVTPQSPATPPIQAAPQTPATQNVQPLAPPLQPQKPKGLPGLPSPLPPLPGMQNSTSTWPQSGSSWGPQTNSPWGQSSRSTVPTPPVQWQPSPVVGQPTVTPNAVAPNVAAPGMVGSSSVPAQTQSWQAQPAPGLAHSSAFAANALAADPSQLSMPVTTRPATSPMAYYPPSVALPTTAPGIVPLPPAADVAMPALGPAIGAPATALAPSASPTTAPYTVHF